MARKVLLISDEDYSPECVGGAAANNVELIKILRGKDYDVRFVLTAQFNISFPVLESADLYIVSNFYFISEEAKQFLYSRKYIIIEHDYKFAITRNPCLYKDLIVPPEHKVHEEFYKKAQLVIVQSALQKSVFDKNIALSNIVNFSGNLWSVETLDFIKSLRSEQKNGKACILGSDDCGIKGRDVAIDFCKRTFLKYDLLPQLPHHDFLSRLSAYSTYVFFPQTPETLSRVCIEARLLNLSVITGQYTGAVHEEFYNLESTEIFQYLLRKRDVIWNLIDSA